MTDAAVTPRTDEAYLDRLEPVWVPFARLLPGLDLTLSEQRRLVKLVLTALYRASNPPKPSAVIPEADRLASWDRNCHLVRPQPSLPRVAWLERPMLP